MMERQPRTGGDRRLLLMSAAFAVKDHLRKVIADVSGREC